MKNGKMNRSPSGCCGTADHLLPADVFCIEGRFFAGSIYGILAYGAFCGSHGVCDLVVFRLVNKKKNEEVNV